MDYIVFLLIVLVASVLQTSSGFGFSILATPFLLLLFEPYEAIQINLVISFIISLLLFQKIKGDINQGVLKRMVIGSMPGLPIGIYVFLIIDIMYLKVIIGSLILFLTTLLLLSFRIRENNVRDYGVAGISGVLTTSVGMPGPPLLLYFSGTNTSKSAVRATTLAFYLFIYLISFFIQFVTVGTSQVVWTSIAMSIPVVLLGLVLGQFLFKRMSQRFFRWLSYALLLFTGIYILVEAFS
ncbi:sulfite exporter TauE/SafE family protein [Alkalihalobacillus pseudalcaliphilus]|uniref:sulfite exporter TauE/SafE family protein n=1 Tax=Alkalihalobacillus pseudalcaliphilus TaxID=79884 RepID=UPI00064D8D0B|nr:sulfite exporter TauE/SafE family protein [Alkalihalobacillus pseudalcaliphilus]KMK78051.1 membrane protein [Alkalihalobacillus pseudalcaliphilus]